MKGVLAGEEAAVDLPDGVGRRVQRSLEHGDNELCARSRALGENIVQGRMWLRLPLGQTICPHWDSTLYKGSVAQR